MKPSYHIEQNYFRELTAVGYFVLWQLLLHILCMKYRYIKLNIIWVPYLSIRPQFSKLKLQNTFAGCCPTRKLTKGTDVWKSISLIPFSHACAQKALLGYNAGTL
jgi:hypothetical protein